MAYVEARIEEIQNGWLVHFAKADSERDYGEKQETVMGIPLSPEDTWYAKDYVEATKLLAENLFKKKD